MESISQEQIQIQMTESNECFENTLIDLLDNSPRRMDGDALLENIQEDNPLLQHIQDVIQKTFEEFNLEGYVDSPKRTSQVARFDIRMGEEEGLKMYRTILKELEMRLGLEEPIRLYKAAPEPCYIIRMEIPLPEEDRVWLDAGNLFRSNTCRETKARIPLMLGKNTSNNTRVLDLATAPHILIGGTTGSGKSVCERLFILSMLLRFSPAELRLILVDPKMVEFSDCQTLPHLLTPVITDVSKVVPMLNWAVGEKNRRYALLKEAGVRDIMEYNSRQVSSEPQTDSEGTPLPEKLPYIVILIDEFADLMLSDRTECENAISRLANSRAVGIHTIISTQRFDRKVLPGSIRVNYPVRIGFKLLSLVDSKFLLGCNGAEMLLGRGDMLCLPPGASEPVRIQGGMVRDEAFRRIVACLSKRYEQHFDQSVLESTGETTLRDCLRNDLHDAMDAILEQNIDFVSRDIEETISREWRYDDWNDALRNDITEVLTEGMETLKESFIDAVFESLDKHSLIGIPSDEQEMMLDAVKAILESRRATVSYLQRALKIGYNKALSIRDALIQCGIIDALEESGVISSETLQ